MRERPDVLIARLAATQRGVVTRAQLRAAGLGRGAIEHRVANGRLHRIHRGVYLVGHAVAVPMASELAAVLACGDGAVLSHRSAAAVWGLARAPQDGIVDVAVPGRDPGRRPGVRLHRPGRLDADDVTTHHGLRITTVARTLLDLASASGTRELERAVAEAETRRLVRPDQLTATLARGPRVPGARALRALLAAGAAPALTRSTAEERLLALLRAAGLPPTATNARVGRHEVDVLYRPQRLVVEVDGYAFHATRAAFERDRARDADLEAAGHRVLRVTWRQITERPEALVARVAQALARRPDGERGIRTLGGP